MDGIQAAVLSVKLKHLDQNNRLRRSRAGKYTGAFAGTPEIRTPIEANFARHVYHIYAIRVADRDTVMSQLEQDGIGCGVHYPVPVHLQDAYRSLGYEKGAFPVSENAAAEFISLPIYPELTDEQIEFVTDRVQDAVGAGALL